MPHGLLGGDMIPIGSARIDNSSAESTTKVLYVLFTKIVFLWYAFDGLVARNVILLIIVVVDHCF